jgi:hypothetical protein
MFKTVDIMCKYSNIGKGGKGDEKEFMSMFNRVVVKENVVNKLDKILENYRKLISENAVKICLKSPIQISSMGKFISDYYDVPINSGFSAKGPTICKNCYIEMKLITDESCFLCIQCGGTIDAAEDITESNSSSSISKNLTSKHDSDIHCTGWLRRIFAIDMKEIPDIVMNHVRNSIALSGIKDISSVKCRNIRDYLQDKKYANYYDYCPLILNKINNSAPAELSEGDRIFITSYVSKCISIYMETKPDWKSKCIYYPYFIYKVIEQVFNRTDIIKFLRHENAISKIRQCRKNPNILYPTRKSKVSLKYREINQMLFSKRKKNILSCIHLQSNDTLTRNDIVFEQICHHIPEFTYIPTNKNIYNTY